MRERLFWFVVVLLGYMAFFGSSWDRRASADGSSASDPTAQGETVVVAIMAPPNFGSYLPQGDPGGFELFRGNTITVKVSWSEGDPTITHLQLTANLELDDTVIGKARAGNCINSGEVDVGDHANELHPDWGIRAQGNGLWNLTGKEYDQLEGRPRLSATTKLSYPRNTPVSLTITSYDWGGWVRLRAGALGYATVENLPLNIPIDSDNDMLPDAWESKQKISNLSGDSDEDFDSRGPFGPQNNKHSQLGDGFSAFEEYRGAIVKGEHRRFDEMRNDGPKNPLFIGEGQEIGGPHVKDVFVIDDGYSIESGLTADFIHRKFSEGLVDLAVVWHKIDRIETVGFGELTAGTVNGREDNDQHALWIVQAALPLGTLGVTLAGEKGDNLPFQTGLLLRIDAAQIDARWRQHASWSDWGKNDQNQVDRINLRTLIGRVAAHESGHAHGLSIAEGQETSHPERTMTGVTGVLDTDTPSFSNFFYDTQANRLRWWVYASFGPPEPEDETGEPTISVLEMPTGKFEVQNLSSPPITAFATLNIGGESRTHLAIVVERPVGFVVLV